MSEKVKLPKEVCEALNFLKKNNQLKNVLIFGYEPELTAEEQIRKLYTIPPTKGYENQKRADHEKSYCGGIVDTLHILGVHYAWMEEDAE